MAASEKGMSFVEPPTDLELHSHTLHDHHNQSAALLSSSSQFDLPLIQLLQKRRFLTLTATNSSADSYSRYNSPASDAEIDARSLPVHKEGPKGMDLAGTDELGVAMEDSLITKEQVMEKKKLLAELAGMNSNSKALHESFKAFHGSSKDFCGSSVIERTASNPSRICRFCRREFPSGRALGGHMRVHGALLDAHTSSVNAIEPEKQKRKRKGEEKLRSHLHEGKDVRVGGDLSASLEHEQREGAGMLGSRDMERAGSEEREVKTCSEVNSESLYQKLDANSVHAHTHAPSREEEEDRDHDVLDLSYCDYSSGYGKSNNSRLPAGDCVEYALSFDSKKHPGLCELRCNPKPSHRFTREQYAAQMNHAMNANGHITPTYAPSTPSAAGDQTHSTLPLPERARPCSECGKVFFSWKALFGHMRCHPEREWRGIQRPDSSVEFDHTVRMTARRLSVAEDPMELLGYGACNKKVEHKNEITKSKEEIVHANTASSEDDEKMASFAIQRKGGTVMATSSELQKGPDTAIETDFGNDEENKNKKDEIPCTESQHVALMHTHTQEMTDDWSPIWSSAGKRSKRRRLSTHMQPALTSETISNEIGFDKKGPELKDQEDLDMANCLVLLSTAGNMQEMNRMSMESTEESAFSHPDKAWRTLSNVDQWEGVSDASDEAVKDGMHDRDVDVDDEAEDDQAQNIASHVAPVLVKYQCSTCKKCFNSHQALGGHRASHRKMKGCFARMKSLAASDAQESSEENDSDDAFFLSSGQTIKGQIMKHMNFHVEAEERAPASNAPAYKSTQSKKKFKGHECSICRRVFATGQALGGHKRCHWTGEKLPGADTASVASSSTNNKKQESSPLVEDGEWGYRNSAIKEPLQKHIAKEDVIDLNLPAPLDEDEEDVGFDAACGALMFAKLRAPMQAWNPAKVAQIQQVCSMQTL